MINWCLILNVGAPYLTVPFISKGRLLNLWSVVQYLVQMSNQNARKLFSPSHGECTVFSTIVLCFLFMQCCIIYSFVLHNLVMCHSLHIYILGFFKNMTKYGSSDTTMLHAGIAR